MEPFASVLALAGAALTLGSLIAAHLLPTGLNPLRDPVSQYGITPYRAWYWSAAAGAAVAGTGGALLFSRSSSGIAIVTVVLLVVFAASRAVIGFVPMDAPGAPRTRTGRAHNLLATAAFAPVTAAAFTGAGVLHDSGGASLSAWSTALGVLMVVGTVGMVIAARSRKRLELFGLFERLIYVGFIAWFVLVGVWGLG